MFTVKATYRNETRKFTFPDLSNFPSFDQLYDQLYRVFRISPSFYLSQILFSPNSSSSFSASQRILLGREAHNAGEYNEHIAPYRGCSWPSALLKFSVHDETPHKSPTTSSNRISMLSTDSGHASVTASEGASSTTAVDRGHAPHSPRRRGDERKLFLERLRERTTTRTNISPPSESIMELSPLISAEASQDAENVHQSSRPLPRTPSPSPDNESAASTITPNTRTARPSLYDLLNRESPSSSNVNTGREAARSAIADILRQDLAALSAHQSEVGDGDRAAPRPSQSISIDVVPPSPSSFTSTTHSGNDQRYQRSEHGPGHRRALVTPRRVWNDNTAVPRPLAERRTRSRPISDSSPLYSGLREKTHRPSLAELLQGEPTTLKRDNSHLHADSREMESRLDSLMKTAQETVSLSRTLSESSDMPPIIIPPPPILSQADMNIGPSPSFIVPPPPILFPSIGFAMQAAEAKSTDTQAVASLVPPSVPQIEVPPPQSAGTADAAVGVEVPACEGTSSGVPQQSQCCSVFQGKIEVQALIDNFLVNLEGTMKKSFGEDWSIDDALKGDSHHCGRCRAKPCGPQSDRRNTSSCRSRRSPVTQRSLSPALPRLYPPPSPPFFPPGFVPNPPYVTPPFIARRPILSHISALPPRMSPPATYLPCLPRPPPLPPLSSTHSVQSSTSSFAPVIPPPPAGWPVLASETSMPPVTPAKSTPSHPGITCDGCRQRNFYGIRYKCMDCNDFDLCGDCVRSVEHIEGHVEHAFRPVIESRAAQQTFHMGITCDSCGRRNIFGVRHKCVECDDYDLCTSCICAGAQWDQHDSSHHFFPIRTTGDMSRFYAARAVQSATRVPIERVEPTETTGLAMSDNQVIHRNTICDSCSNVVIGIRHKCLDCPDYDLCSQCYAIPDVRSEHGTAHQFFAIERPGEVIVHTIFSGDDERVPPTLSPQRHSGINSQESVARRAEEPLMHSARCNLCESRIWGERYKCVNCPDFDTCSSCFQITTEQHPGHGFVKITKPEDLVMRDALNNEIVHAARCNICNQSITGVRYKCLHPLCVDFDLCQSCEALPFPVHPAAHPMLKMKTRDTVIPMVLHPSQNMANQQAFVDDLYREPMSSGEQGVDQRCERASQMDDHWQSLLSQLRADNEVEQTGLALDESEVLRRYPDIPPMAESKAATPSAPLMQSMDMPTTTTAPFPLPSVCCTDEPVYSPVMHPFDEPLVNLPTPRRRDSPATPPCPLLQTTAEEHLIDLEEGNFPNNATGGVSEPATNGLTTPSEAPASSSSSNSVPRLDPVPNNEWRELWPELTSMLKHLLQPPTPSATASAHTRAESMPGAMFVEDKSDDDEQLQITEPRPAVEESPLVGEPLLQRPLVPERANTVRRDIRDYFNVPPPPPLRKDTKPAPHPRDPPKLVSPPREPSPTQVVSAPQPLFASFVSDNNIPDGQVFPPGAEFVKSWKMANQGTSDWPESTELVFVAGDRMAPHSNAPRYVKVGSVKAGAEVEIVAGEMKAPEIPGKYVSYWRLSDGNGNQFGHSIWVDISVAEVTRAMSSLSTTDESLAASSVIMPRAAQDTDEPRIILPPHAVTGPSEQTLSVTLPSGPPSEDSFDSSLSLVDAPSSPISEDLEAYYREVREHVSHPMASVSNAPEPEYVMLYDSASSASD